VLGRELLPGGHAVFASFLAVEINGKDATEQASRGRNHRGRGSFPPTFNLIFVAGGIVKAMAAVWSLVLGIDWEHWQTEVGIEQCTLQH
jgi:hypothetical protein